MTADQLLDHQAGPAPLLDPPPVPADLPGLSTDDWQGWEDGAYVLAYLRRIDIS